MGLGKDFPIIEVFPAVHLPGNRPESLPIGQDKFSLTVQITMFKRAVEFFIRGHIFQNLFDRFTGNGQAAIHQAIVNGNSCPHLCGHWGYRDQ